MAARQNRTEPWGQSRSQMFKMISTVGEGTRDKICHALNHDGASSRQAQGLCLHDELELEACPVSCMPCIRRPKGMEHHVHAVPVKHLITSGSHMLVRRKRVASRHHQCIVLFAHHEICTHFCEFKTCAPFASSNRTTILAGLVTSGYTSFPLFGRSIHVHVCLQVTSVCGCWTN